MIIHFRTNVLALILFFLTVPTHVLSSQDDPVKNGSEAFKLKCASCHGDNAKGKDAASIDLEVNSPDLTKIAERNNGKFPVARVYAIIDGREVVEEHGSRSMPAWGDLFLTETIWEGCSQIDEIIVRGRIMELILYLDSIQE